MLCLIPIIGGLLIMIGQHDRSKALFYYFRLEDRVPETHLLRLNKCLCAGKAESELQRYRSPSIDPELLLRILLIGYLYGSSERRKLNEERKRAKMLLYSKVKDQFGMGRGDRRKPAPPTHCSCKRLDGTAFGS